MEYKHFPGAALRLPEIGFGTWRYRGGVLPLRKAIELGAHLIDTAESYGTEEIVGEAIRGVRDRVFLATKARPRHFRRADLLKSADESLKRLGVGHIDLYQLHWPNYTVPIAETMATMEELVDRGKIRFIGVSNFSVSDLEKAQAALARHKIDIKERDAHRTLERVSGLTGKSEGQVALNWCITKSQVIAIPKASSVDHVQDDCGAAGWRLSPEHVALLDRGIGFRRRGRVEARLRRVARHLLQRLGRNQ